MVLNTHRKYDPWWLRSLPEATRQEVINWLSQYVNVEHCAWFEYDGHEVIAQLYELDPRTNGPAMSITADPLYGARVKFIPKSTPSIVQQYFEEGS